MVMMDGDATYRVRKRLAPHRSKWSSLANSRPDRTPTPVLLLLQLRRTDTHSREWTGRASRLRTDRLGENLAQHAGPPTVRHTR